ncbi:response regulator transcription factor [Pantoea sp. Bo_2]|uniref:Response regulator transcription factor n=1 Tax=Candidatus Pantoea gossypiicola TaxID=2608008 RepID=A0AB34CGV7_9GAMM|nr:MULTISPECIES: response regulator transcription factor [Pantoea]KAA5928263.1 response regulator transcription factor [Pantoea sp. VH_8]KAA5933343.1 response regulator transcription factor [Pantoea sp. VH_4]KAA5947925.1 response regulator transcription factor [Pantoea sp. VH_3]KAA5952675.1 response regulator transcription factor [Pantoea sp. VH_25]KAA5958297.1 response regulator transcription factor [Pantoea sp. VH_24]
MCVILVIDDHPAICFAVKAVLEKEPGFTVATSRGGQVLLQLHQHAPQLLILDIALENEDGLLLLPRIREHYPDCKILIHSGLPAQSYAGRALQAGADGFISKQTSLLHLLPACHLLLNGYTVFPTGIALQSLSDNTRDPRQLLAKFSNREMVVLRLLQEGKSHKAIADQLALSHKTVSTYKARILEKSGANSIEQLTEWLAADAASP